MTYSPIQLAVAWPNFAPHFMRTGSKGRPAKSRDNNERREPGSINRSGTAAASGGACIFQSRVGTMDRPPARTYDRRDGQAYGSSRISGGSNDEPALILDNSMKVGNTLRNSLISTHGKSTT